MIKHFLSDQAFNALTHEKLESIQYSAYLALGGTIRGSSNEKLYQELGLESLQLCRFTGSFAFFIRFPKISLQPICLN